MNTARYVLAKYVPDLGRMEPRNIGVIVWSKGELCARFLDKADSRSVQVNDPDTYERWIAYWSGLVARDAIRPRRGRPVSAGDPKCIDALLSTQKGNYILVDSGELLEQPRKSELKQATDYLFEDLVAIPGHKEKASPVRFDQACDGVFHEAGVEFKSHQPIECDWNGITRTLHPDYYVGNGKPDAIFHRANLKSESNVNGGLFLVQSLMSQEVVTPEACRFLIRTRDITSTIAEEGLEICKHTCGVIDIDDASATDAIRELALRKL
jgi:hypothetical protein